MRSFVLMVLGSALALAQNNPTARGEDIFSKTCATGYCHGLRGAAGGAPRLAARGFSAQYIRQVVTGGYKEMPAFGGKLEARDLNAVVGYVAALNGVSQETLGRGGAGRGGTGTPARTLSSRAAQGRALFFDATRGFGRCSTCHQLEGHGIAITDPVTRVPDGVASLRALTTPAVRTFRCGAESFPAVIVKKSGGEAIVYDLTSSPPVLRSFWDAKFEIENNSSWQHSAVMASYNDADLESVLAFLREVVKP